VIRPAASRTETRLPLRRMGGAAFRSCWGEAILAAHGEAFGLPRGRRTRPWKTRIVRTNLRDEILKLKQEQGKDILVGGVDIPSQLMQLGLIDEYRFVVGPTIVGEGRRLFDGVSLPEKLRLKLVESKIFESGTVALHYLKQ
jgi:dihydrofolate reductase